MKQTQRPAMYEQIQKHGENLNRIFNTGIDPVTLCKRLRRYESKLNKLATDYCNGDNGVNSDNIEELAAPIMQQVYKLLKNGIYMDDRPHMRKVPVFFNTDCRGYALKINDQYLRAYNIDIYKDWGGYGILAPDFNP